MKTLKIIKKDGYNYILEDENKNLYNLNLEFYSVETPKENNYLLMNEYLLEENVPLSFGPLSGKYGREVTEGDKDLIKIITEDKEIILKRYYG